MSAIVVAEQYITYFGNPSGQIQGVIGSALAAGSVLGSAIAGPISNKIGRRDTLMLACIPWFIGTGTRLPRRDRQS